MENIAVASQLETKNSLIDRITPDKRSAMSIHQRNDSPLYVNYKKIFLKRGTEVIGDQHGLTQQHMQSTND